MKDNSELFLLVAAIKLEAKGQIYICYILPTTLLQKASAGYVCTVWVYMCNPVV